MHYHLSLFLKYLYIILPYYLLSITHFTIVSYSIVFGRKPIHYQDTTYYIVVI